MFSNNKRKRKQKMTTTASALDSYKLQYEEVKPHKHLITSKRKSYKLPKLHTTIIHYCRYLVEVILK